MAHILSPRSYPDNVNGGHIQLILGPMFSGKTSELMRRVRRYQLAQFECFLVKYAHDKRYSDSEMSSHDLNTMPAYSCVKLSDIAEKCTSADVIAIDEGQFFPDVINFCESLANNGKIVIVSGLDGTYQRKPFNDFLNLVPLAEIVDKFSAVCTLCKGKASFTKRLTGETGVEIIGGTDKYTALCRKCFFMENVTEYRSPLKANLENVCPVALFSGMSPRKHGASDNL